MRYVSYLRVSTDQQGATGNGIEAQRAAVNAFVAAEGAVVVREFVEVESGSDNSRPVFQEAVVFAQLSGAVLLVKTLDRISRDLHFITALEKSEVSFKIVDMPSADRFTLHIYGSLAERERELISMRTKAALQRVREYKKLGTPENLTDNARAEGRRVSLEKRKGAADGFAAKIMPIIEKYRAEGLGYAAVADRLNAEGLRTRKGGEWLAMGVKRVMER